MAKMKISPLAGKPAPLSILTDIPKLLAAYYSQTPDPAIPAQKVSFGTSGHRGSSFDTSFNENHILAIAQGICDYRKIHNIDGPLFLGIDTHALSEPAFRTAVEVLVANEVKVSLSKNSDYTPTPVISHAILTYNRGRTSGLSDGIVITPSHNPPREGGFKYNSSNGGPADVNITEWIEQRANELLSNIDKVKRKSFEIALKSTKRHDFLSHYIRDLESVLDMDAIRNLKLGVDPLGGAGIDYWGPIADHYKLNLKIVNKVVDPTFRFMTVDWDGQIRMDPSSPYAMQGLIDLKDQFDLSFACDTDHDRHGIVTKSEGLLPPNHYLCVVVYYLYQNRPDWSEKAAIGKTVVTTDLITRIGAKLGRKTIDVPVGFKWFSQGLFDGTLGFGGEESAGASFLRKNGTVWTTDKDGMIAALLAAEITAKMGRDPGEVYRELTKEFGEPVFERLQAHATPKQKSILKKITPTQIHSKELAGEKIQAILTNAPGNNAPIGGIKVVTENGWFAARPSGTEDIYKIYAESFKGKDHIDRILEEAQTIVDTLIS